MLRIESHNIVVVFFLVIMILLLLLFGINSLFISYIFSFINKSRNTIVTILSIVPIGLGKLYCAMEW